MSSILRALLPILSLPLLIVNVNAEVTIYTQVTFGANGPTPASPSALPTSTNPAAFDPTVLTPPQPPNPPVGGATVVQLLSGGMPGMGLPVQGGFVGFSVELSVADQVLGKNGSFINPQFLNLLEGISQRAGRCIVRIGGNSQESAKFFPEGLPNQQTIVKDKSNVRNPTDTPTLEVGIDLLYAMSNISSLTNTQWFIGAPFDTPSTPRLGIAEYSERILGERLLGLQIGNEPDLFAPHKNRPDPYGPPEYAAEFQQFVNALKSDSNIQKQNSLVVPSTCCEWGVLDLQNQTGFFDNFGDLINMIAVEHYPSDYCTNDQGTHNHEPQPEYEAFMSHARAVGYGQTFPGLPEFATSRGKPLILMETNTASCGGFPGFSDSFGAALWLIDASLNLAVNNYTASLFHVGGQNTFYNPFTPAPGSLLRRGGQWTIGAPYYTALIIAELIGASGKAQVVDIGPNNNNEFTPGYAIYEDGKPVRAIFLNYITDPSGANDYTAQIAIDGSGVGLPNGSPAEVYVRYFTTPANATNAKIPFFYGNQTFGGVLESNGIIQGTLDTEVVPCDTNANTCSIKVPTPGAAVVFFSKEAADNSLKNGPAEPKVFSTTVTSVEMHNTATIEAQVLATSNGYGGKHQELGTTSFGSSNDDSSAPRGLRMGLATVAGAVVLGAVVGSWVL